MGGELVERVDEQDRVLAVVDRGEAIRRRWLHRIATIVCRHATGRILVHRRPDAAARFPGRLNWMLGGAVNVAESYEDAAARELAEELGVRARPRVRVRVRVCRGDQPVLARPARGCRRGTRAARSLGDRPARLGDRA